VGSGVLSVRLWAPAGCAGAALGECRAGLVGQAIGGAWVGAAAEVACGISGAPAQAWERRA